MIRCLALILGLAAGFAGPAGAEEPAAFRDFTFKRVKVPAAGTRPVLVQIDPEEQARLMKPRVPPSPATPAMAGEPGAPVSAWFWDRVPRGGIGAGGLEPVLAHLSQPPALAKAPPPRMQALQRIADRHGAAILAATIGTDVSPALVLAVIAVESAGREAAVSSAGAEGLMQLMPATAARFGVTDSFDAAENIRGGVRYLHWLMARFDRDPVLVLAAYNAGEGAVDANGGVPPYAETLGYVPKVLAAFAVARGLCATPPELVSDGCVFVGARMAHAG